MRGSRGVRHGTWVWMTLTACGDLSLELVPRAAPSPRESAAPLQAIAPVDDRPSIRAEVPPPPIAGGTLLVSRDGRLAVAADRERDTVSAVDLDAEVVSWTTSLDPSSRPGRVVESTDGRFHVALRGAGAIATLNRDGSLLYQTAVCPDPTGLAVSEQRAALLVACRDGSLLALAPETRTLQLLTTLDPDLRDIIVQQATDGETETVHATRFRSAEILTLDESLSVAHRETPSSSTAFDRAAPASDPAAQEPGAAAIDMDPAVAWRATPTGDGFVLLHQRGRRQSVRLAAPAEVVSEFFAEPAYGHVDDDVVVDDSCAELAGPAVTFVARDGGRAFSKQLPGRLLVDVAESNDGWIALAEAGSPDVDSSTTSSSARAAGLTLPRSGANVPVVSLFRRFSLDRNAGSPSGCELSGATVTTPEYNQAVAVAFNPVRPSQLVALLRDPAQLLLVDLNRGVQTGVELSSHRTTDTGHALFHQATPSGIACATCHPEGGEDGRVWVFDQDQKRRTQSLEVGLRETAPFHWQGELSGISSVMDEVFVRRMGGIPQSQQRLDALESWLFELERPAPLRDPSDALAVAGKLLFESDAVGCTNCHQGPSLTDNQSYDVGTGEVLQVPSLVGVAYRAPLMHDGCAADLWDRFDPSCGGSAHGATAELTLEQLRALVAYMEAL